VERGVLGVDLAIISVPLRGVAVGGINVLEGDGEVDEVEIEVFQSPVLELELASGLDVFLGMESIPELGSNPDVFTLDEASINGLLNAITSLLLVAVVSSTVQETVAGLDGVKDGVGALRLGNLPETKANKRKLGTGARQSKRHG